MARFRPASPPPPSPSSRCRRADAGAAPGLIATFDDGATWADVYRGTDRSSLIEVGFTSRSQGVAIEVPTEALAGALLMTLDDGHTWKPAPFG